jgi:integrase
LKNRSSRRNVPLHPMIIEAGFLTWVKAREDGPLFPGTSSAAGKRYSRWARKLVADKSKVFHSWRHTVKDRMRAARVPDVEQRAILGHAGNGVADAYGLGYPLKVLAEAVAKITY